MPNWCSNGVTVSHPDPFKIKALEDAMKEGKFLNFAIPVPEDLQITAGYLGDGDKQTELERKTAENVEKYGYGNWYDFCVARWGTKWEVDCEVDRIDDNTVSASFESAWAPPIGVYEELEDLGFKVTAFYYEPGMGFVGKWEGGIEEYFEYGGETSDTVREVIGEELDDYFGISENMAEWEEENKEEEDDEEDESAT